MSISINKVNKFYGKQQALTDVSFSLNKGEIVGFLGPNGAGKSTLMKIITCYLEQDSGMVQVCDLNTIEQNLKVKAKIGYLPEHNPLYTDMYIKEYLTFVGRIYKVQNLNNRITEIIQQTGLTAEQSKKIGELSKGFKQRVGLAAALIHNPEILILDEPTTGLDPNQLVEIRNLIKEVGKDKTVLLSTHIMQEVDKMCNRIIIINKGKIVEDQLISNLQKDNIDLEEHFRKLTA
ncbi:MAG: ATP-binding cassette domain-containing protein [Cryomorphaceae bacterium]|jgi:ABC-2 type transport system ATP-binding protein|nr:ATP-binding cassette domain-containing protein [Cryomorphaceae bacterium]